MQVGKYLGWLKVGVFGAVLALALAGCTEPTPTGKLPDPPSSAASSATDSSDAPTTSAAPTTTYTPEEQAVIDQYKGFYEAYYLVPSYEDADIRATFEPYAVPAVVDQTVVSLQDLVSDGIRPSGIIYFGSISVVISGGNATVVECRDTSTESFVSTVDGSVISHGAPGTRFEVELQISADQRWLVWKSSGQDFGC